MNLLHVVPSYLPATRYGGPIYSVHALCGALARRGHRVEVYTTNVNGPGVSPVPIDKPVDLDGVKVTYFATGIGRRIYRSPAMAAALRRNVSSFDVVHVHSVFLWPTLAASAQARAKRVPYVLCPRGMLVFDLIRRKSRLIKSVWIELFERRNLAGAAAIHVTSEIEEVELGRLGIRTQRIAVIPNGIDPPQELSIHGPTRLLEELSHPFVLYLGRINWKKGLDRLISAMAHIPQTALVIAGNDEEDYRPQLEALAARHGVADRTYFVGPAFGAEKWQLLAAADVFALLSYSENFGVAVLEAMASATPVVVTPEVGLARTIYETGAGQIVDGDPAAAGDAIRHLLADPDKRQRMGQAGRRAALERFSWDSIAKQTEVLYDEIVDRAVSDVTKHA